METLPFVRRVALGAASTLLALAATALAARANELTGGGFHNSKLHLVSAEETLRDHCEWRGAQLWLTLPGGIEFELVTSAKDPVIANPGDGRFHPYDVAEVERAFAAVSFPLEGVGADVYLLPFPRRVGLESAAAPGIILLSPGTRPLSAEHQHAEAVHELGHIVQYVRLPDSDVATWDRYRRLRGIEDAALFSPAAMHADRPHEIFAEDFRALFGGRLANYSGSIENAELKPPGEIPSLYEFLRGLAAPAPAPASVTLTAWPNPSRGSVTFTRAASSTPVDVFDVNGRRLATLSPTGIAAGVTEWRWDGRDEHGRKVTGVVFAKAREGRAPAIRLTRLP